MLRIGIDIGGTFTDFVVFNLTDDRIETFKLLSDPQNPDKTVLQGLRSILNANSAQIIHGSTVATNALLERKGARTALITTKGFKDILQIGRQNRPNLYDWNEKPPPALINPELRFEIGERVSSAGEIIIPIDTSELDSISRSLTDSGVESIAICLLFSFLFPDHEKQLAHILRSKGFRVSVSSEILPEYREYERMSTTVVNAYVSPILEKYLLALEKKLPDTSLQIMQSNGGMISLPEARANGVRCILSGPSAGIVGAQAIANAIMTNCDDNSSEQKVKIITFDMGGTSTDVSLIDGQPTMTTDAIVGGCPIHIPLLDIHTIGSGGGSIAYTDAGGSLRVGPQSAGADPGPACYGKGDFPTVTDANLVLGRLIPDYFLGGQMDIYPHRAFSAISKLANSLNLSPVQAAYGVIEVVNIQMERALRVISVERGHDPSDFSLFSFGGAGGLHASSLAHNLGIPKIIISRFASTLSAFGMLATNIIKDYVHTVMLPGNTSVEKLQASFAQMSQKGIFDIRNEGIAEDAIKIHCSLDARYIGQSYELNIPYTTSFHHDFQTAHLRLYGYSYPDKAIEIVNLRLKAVGAIPQIRLPEIPTGNQNFSLAPIKYQQVELNGSTSSIPLYDFEHLLPGMQLTGPALVVSPDTTILIDQGDKVNIDKYQNLLIDIKSSW
jgi:N-methylhydantoinase A